MVCGRRLPGEGARSWLAFGDLRHWYRRTLQLHRAYNRRMLLVCGIDEDWESRRVFCCNLSAMAARCRQGSGILGVAGGKFAVFHHSTGSDAVWTQDTSHVDDQHTVGSVGPLHAGTVVW